MRKLRRINPKFEQNLDNYKYIEKEKRAIRFGFFSLDKKIQEHLTKNNFIPENEIKNDMIIYNIESDKLFAQPIYNNTEEDQFHFTIHTENNKSIPKFYLHLIKNQLSSINIVATKVSSVDETENLYVNNKMNISDKNNNYKVLLDKVYINYILKNYILKNRRRRTPQTRFTIRLNL